MRKFLYSGILLLTLASLSFSSCNNVKTDKGEEEAAEIEAAQMEGRNAARIFINRQWKDTTDLQRNLLEARSGRAKYDTVGKTHCAAAYDSAFVSTIRTVNPDVARQLK